MTDQELKVLAVEFLALWEQYQNSPLSKMTGVAACFENLTSVKKFIELDFIADHTNPREGEYALQHEYTGVAFFTGSGELVFTEKGLPFAKKCAEIYCQKDNGSMQVMKVIAQYPR